MLARSELKSGYVVVDVPLGLGGAVHQLYVKEHSGKEIGSASSSSASSSSSSSSSSLAAASRTVFVGNADLSLDLSHEDIDAFLRQLFSPFGEVEAVLVSALDPQSAQRSRKRNRSSNSASSESADVLEDDGVLSVRNITTERCRFAHVRFTSKKGVAGFLKAARLGQLDFVAQTVGRQWGLGRAVAPEGARGQGQGQGRGGSAATAAAAAAGWVPKSIAAIRQSLSIGDHKRTLAQLKTDVNAYMAEFEELEALEKTRVKSREAGVDSEGFTVVTGRNKRKKAHSGETGKSKARKRQKKHKGTVELKNFYRFQFREHKRDALLTLREAFAKDQETIAALKEKRKFKPF